MSVDQKLEYRKRYRLERRRCVVKGCGNNADTGEGIALHGFPFVNDTRPEAAERLQRWVDFVHERTPEWPAATRARYCFICSAHFSAQDFVQMFSTLPGFNGSFAPRLIKDEIGIKAYPKFQVESPTEELEESTTRTSKRIKEKEQLQTIITSTETAEINAGKPQNNNNGHLGTDINQPVVSNNTVKHKNLTPRKASKKLKTTKKNPVTSGGSAAGEQSPKSKKVKKRKATGDGTSKHENTPSASKKCKTANQTARKSTKRANTTGKTQPKKKTLSKSQSKNINIPMPSSTECEVPTESEDIDSKEEIRKQIAMGELVQASLGCIAQEVKQEIEEHRQQEKLEQLRLREIAREKAREQANQRIQKQRQEMRQKRLEAKQRDEQRQKEEENEQRRVEEVKRQFLEKQRRLEQEEMERQARKRKWLEEEQLEQVKKNEEIIDRISELEAGIHTAKKKQKDCKSKVILLKEKIQGEENCREPEVLEIPQGALVPHILKAVEKHLMGDKCKEAESDIQSSGTISSLGDNANRICIVEYKLRSAGKTEVNVLLKTNNFESQENRSSTQLPRSPHLPAISQAPPVLPSFNTSFFSASVSPVSHQCGRMDQSYIQLATRESQLKIELQVEETMAKEYEQEESDVTLELREETRRTQMILNSDEYKRQQEQALRGQSKSYIVKTTVKKIEGNKELRQSEPQNATVITLGGTNQVNKQINGRNKVSIPEETQNSETTTTSESTRPGNLQSSTLSNETSTSATENTVPRSETTTQGVAGHSQSQEAIAQNSVGEPMEKPGEETLEATITVLEQQEKFTQTAFVQTNTYDTSKKREVLMYTTEKVLTDPQVQALLNSKFTLAGSVQSICEQTTKDTPNDSSVQAPQLTQAASIQGICEQNTENTGKDSSAQAPWLTQTASVQTKTHDKTNKRTVWLPTTSTEKIWKDSSIQVPLGAKDPSNDPVTTVSEPQAAGNAAIEVIKYDHGHYTKNIDATRTVTRVTPVYYPSNTKEFYTQTVRSGCDECKSISTERRRMRHKAINFEIRNKKRNNELHNLRRTVAKLESNQVTRDKELEEANKKMKEAEKNFREQKQLVNNYKRKEELRKKDKERRKNEKERKKRAKERRRQLRERRKLAKLRKKEKLKQLE